MYQSKVCVLFVHKRKLLHLSCKAGQTAIAIPISRSHHELISLWFSSLLWCHCFDVQVGNLPLVAECDKVVVHFLNHMKGATPLRNDLPPEYSSLDITFLIPIRCCTASNQYVVVVVIDNGFQSARRASRDTVSQASYRARHRHQLG